jgi:hypothetical protein
MEDSRLGRLPRKGDDDVPTSKLKNEEVGYGGKEEGEGKQEEGWQEEEVVSRSNVR